MKSTINKSQLFKRAWKLYRIEGKARVIQIGCAKIKEEAKSFGWCLKKVWEQMKNEIAWIIRKAAKAVEVITEPSAEVAAHNASMLIAYNNGSLAYQDGRYVGD